MKSPLPSTRPSYPVRTHLTAAYRALVFASEMLNHFPSVLFIEDDNRHSLTLAGLDLCAAGYRAGYQPVYVDFLQGTVGWSNTLPSDQAPIDLKALGLCFSKLQVIQVYSSSLSQVLVEIFPHLEEKRCMLVIDSLRSLRLLIELQHPEWESNAVEKHLQCFLVRLKEQVKTNDSTLVLLCPEERPD